MKTFLVTGATGFLGSHLVNALLEQGHKVIGLSRSGRRQNGLRKNAKYYRVDLTKRIPDIVGKGRIHGIFNLASQLGHTGNIDFAKYFEGNVATVRNVIEFAKRKNVPFIVHVSSCSVFGKRPEKSRISERVVPSPADHYGLTKFIGERLLEIEFSHGPVKVVVIRFPVIFGENDSFGVVNTLWKFAKTGADIELYSNGERYRNLIHVSDAVRALLEVHGRLSALEGYQEIIVGNKISITVLELAKKIKALLKSRSKIVKVNRYSTHDWDVFLDTRKAERLLGFKPMSVSEGLKMYAVSQANSPKGTRTPGLS